jgi:hypothetical protein
MGQVFRATDTKLKRQVSIKICRHQSRPTRIGWRGFSTKGSIRNAAERNESDAGIYETTS